jgi:hypothetical protein
MLFAVAVGVRALDAPAIGGFVCVAGGSDELIQ